MKKNEDDNKPRQNKILEGLAHVSQIGFTIAANILLAVLIGKYLDKYLHSEPWLLIIFSLLGVASAIKSLFTLS